MHECRTLRRPMPVGLSTMHQAPRGSQQSDNQPRQKLTRQASLIKAFPATTGKAQQAGIIEGTSYQTKSGFLEQEIQNVSPCITAPQPARQFGELLHWATDVIALGGHRGMGMNILGVPTRQGNLQYRENTLRSFQQAAACGASFVEFDVQVTSDGVPVIWHDNTVLTGSLEQPEAQAICDLTLEQFRGLVSQAGLSAAQPLLRSATQGKPAGSRLWRVEEDDQLPTLAELFQQLPEKVSFDIEVKMTTPDSAPCTEPAEIQRMADAIQRVVQQQRQRDGGRRTILFSSFDPDMCAELASRQAAPVMLLSDGGLQLYADPRRNSIQAAIAFASGAGLKGIILETAALRQEQHCVEAAQNQGLQVLTFGMQNDEPEWVRKQFFLGVHGVIADDVAGVAAALSSSKVAM